MGLGMTNDQETVDAWSTDEVAARTQAFTDLVLVATDLKKGVVLEETLAMLKAIRSTIEPSKAATLTAVSKLRDTSHKL